MYYKLYDHEESQDIGARERHTPILMMEAIRENQRTCELLIRAANNYKKPLINGIVSNSVVRKPKRGKIIKELRRYHVDLNDKDSIYFHENSTLLNETIMGWRFSIKS